MAICPSCLAQIEIKSEFFGGLFTCSKCESVYFIGFDGEPETATASQSAAPQAPVVEEPYTPPMDLPPLVSYEAAPESPSYDQAPAPFSPLQDVVDFANSESSGSLATYSLEVSGLDSQQNMRALKEVLIDSKIQINFDEVKSQIKNGTLRLEKLNSAQAAVIAFRLRPLPLKMKWEQSLL